MLRKSILLPIMAAALATVTSAATAAAANDDVTPPPMPSNLVVTEAEGRPFKIGHAYGTQQYVCLPSATAFAWILYGPQATLFDDETDQIMTHFLSPNPVESGTPRATWQHSRDTSSVWAMAVASSTDPAYVAPGAIAWLKLQVVGAQLGPEGGNKLARTTFIQRVNTAGGAAPATGCGAVGDVGKKALVPYTTDYIFYRDRH
jgi:hypothetical protein